MIWHIVHIYMDIHTQCSAAAESCLNIREDQQMKAENWYSVAWMPVYDQVKSKLPSQGYESNSARAI